DSMGCEIRSSLDTVILGTTSVGVTVHFDAQAKKAKHVIVVNRVKPHTRISGPYESGLVKMMLVGLGKHRGAAEYHRAMTRQTFDEIVTEAGPLVLSHANILLGLAVIENAFDQITHVEAIDADQLLDREPELLELARRKMPRLPFEVADLLIIDRIGKNISGSGLDTNVVGRKFNDKVAGPTEWPKIRQIFVRGLTPQTHCNATGIGIAEYCRSRVVHEMDVEITRINCLTALHVTAAATPVHWETDREVLGVASDQTGRTSAEMQCLWIPDTLHVAEVMCSEAYYAEAQQRDDLEVIHPPEALKWDGDGNLQERFAP
ncbi:MAG: [Fe-S]-binding protein, partial [Planctomycetaceae bacterium]